MDPTPYAVFEGRLPSRSEAAEIRRRGFGLQLWKEVSAADGQRLQRSLPELERLLITGLNLELSWLKEMKELVGLSVNGVIADAPDLSELRRLESYAGTLKGAESVFDNPRTSDVAFSDVRDGSLPSIPSHIIRLDLTDLQGVRRLEAREQRPLLDELLLTGARRFDAGSLSSFTNLTRVSLTQGTTIAGLESLATLPKLRRVDLEACRGLESLQTVLDLSHVEVHIWGRGKFAASVRERVTAAKATIVFH